MSNQIFLVSRNNQPTILEQIDKKLKEEPTAKILVIVPDRLVLTYHAKLFDYLNIEGSANIEVTSFRVLAKRSIKGKKLKILDSQSLTLLLLLLE